MRYMAYSVAGILAYISCIITILACQGLCASMICCYRTCCGKNDTHNFKEKNKLENIPSGRLPTEGAPTTNRTMITE